MIHHNWILDTSNSSNWILMIHHNWILDTSNSSNWILVIHQTGVFNVSVGFADSLVDCDFSWKIKEENDRSVDIQFFIVILHKFKLLGQRIHKLIR